MINDHLYNLLLHKQLLSRLLFGPCIPPSYRLRGPHPWNGARDAIMSSKKNTEIPTMTRTIHEKRNTCRPNLGEENYLQKQDHFDHLLPEAFMWDLRISTSSILLRVTLIGIFLGVSFLWASKEVALPEL